MLLCNYSLTVDGRTQQAPNLLFAEASLNDQSLYYEALCPYALCPCYDKIPTPQGSYTYTI